MAAAGNSMPTSPSTAAALYAQLSDVTLVKEFLRPWVTSGDTTAAGGGAYVHVVDLYSADPEKLARRFQPAVSMDGNYTWYFLSPLRNKSPRDRRKKRAVADGTGCWHSEAAPKDVVDHLDSGRHVGYRQSFSFMRRSEAGVDVRSGWIMAEFHLHNEGLGKKIEGLVLCKMYRSPRNHGPAVAPDGEDDVCCGLSLSAETTFSCGKSKVLDDEYSGDSNAVMVGRQWYSRSSDGVVKAPVTAMAAPILKKKKVAENDEVCSTTMAMEPSYKNKAVTTADNEGLLVSLPARKKMKMAMPDTECSGAALAFKATAAAAAPQLHCPRCGFHLAALQAALVTLTKSMLGVHRETRTENMDEA